MNVYESINFKKSNEFLIREDCTLLNLANKITCIVSELD